MWNFLKKAAGNFVQATAQYYENRMFIQQLFGLPEAQALQMLQARVQSLDDRGYQEFVGAIYLLVQEAQATWQQVQSSFYNSNTAFDDSYEGQLYGALAHASEGPRIPSSAETYQMQQIQQYAQTLQAIAMYADQFRTAMPRGNARANAVPANNTPVPPPARAAGSAEIRQRLGEAFERGAGNDEILRLVMELGQAESEEGTISPERKKQLDAVMQEAESLIDGEESDDVGDLMVQAEKARQIARDLTPALADPSLPNRKTAAPPRARRAAALLGRIKTQLANESTHLAHTAQEKSACKQLLGNIIPIQNGLNEARTDEEIYKLEREALRPLALKMQDLFLRQHMLVSVPYFPTRPVTPDPNAVFFSGQSDLRQKLGAVCKIVQLSLQAETVSENLAEQRWNQLRASAVAIFDFRQYARAATFSVVPEQASAVATVAYELGIALAIGKPVVVVINHGQEVPFDIDIAGAELRNEPGDLKTLQAAIENALYGRQRGGEGSSVETTIKFLQRKYRSHSNPVVRTALSTLETEEDPIRVRLIVGQMLRALGDKAPQIISTSWPGDYPDSKKKFCFHITAFENKDRQWPAEVRKIVEESCPPAIAYKRGDDSQEHNIIRAIWHDICRAWCLVVDLTDLNPNAVIELAMAHTLGRKCFIMTQDEKLDQFPPILAKERLCVYKRNNELKYNILRDSIIKFFESL